MHYVYFIQQAGKGDRPVKIGYSKDPELRLLELQTANPYKLKICVKLPFSTKKQAITAERTMHNLAEKKHQSLLGEWFIIRGSWPKFIEQSLKMCDKASSK